MDKKLKRTDRERVVKDRGDLKKALDLKNVEPSVINFEDRGDSKTLDIVLHFENDKPLKKCCTTQTPPILLIKRPNQRFPTKLLAHVEGRRILAERYTIRRKINEGKERDPECKAKGRVVLSCYHAPWDGRFTPKRTPYYKGTSVALGFMSPDFNSYLNTGTPQKSISIEASKEQPNPECGTNTKDPIKPVLKILSKDDTVKLCKAVTFDFANKQLRGTGRPFRKPSRFSMRTLRSRKIKPLYKTRVRASSPTLARASPPTEVAKWAPSCLKHAKPYYEAWVDTTLAAISKEKRKLGEKELRKALERPSTPEMVYGDVTDEKFTGRIRVKI